MHAIIQTGGKQYRVAVGDQIEIEKLGSNAGEQVNFPVLLIEEGENIKLGKPTLDGAAVTAEIVKQTKDKKVIAYNYKRRKGYDRKIGHRQPLTLIKITDIKG